MRIGELVRYTKKQDIGHPTFPWMLLNSEEWYCPECGQVGLYVSELVYYMVILFEDQLVCVYPEYLESIGKEE